MKFTIEQERKLIECFLEPCGVSSEDARVISDVVSYSDFTGTYSHGLSRFRTYVRQYQSGALNPKPDIRKVCDSGAVVKYDCDHSSGLVAVNRVYESVLEKAKTYGVAIGCASHAANIGCGAYYGRRAESDGMLCIFMSNTYPAMAPFGGAERLVGTNPIVMAAPAGEKTAPILDISTSTVAIGKVTAYAREGKTMPEGWATDIDGRPTTDASIAHAVTPVGGYKGYGLAVFVDILSAVLTGTSYGAQIPFVTEMKYEDTGFALILIDVERFMPLSDFKARIDDYISMIKNSRKAVGVSEIFMPGEIENLKYTANVKDGMDISDATCLELTELAVSMGLLDKDGSLYELCK